jgi:hypothetical protein
MPEPTQTCKLCGRSLAVQPDGRGFPPDITRRKLRRLCNDNGCPCLPEYRAGVQAGGRVTGQGIPHA